MSSWTTSGPGKFVRSLGENETFIKMVSDPGLPLGREHWAINSTATIKPAINWPASRLEIQLRRAWAHLRFQHPNLAARVAEDQASLIYEVPGPCNLEEWIAQTFVIARDKTSAAEVIAALEPEAYAKLVYIPHSHELLGHSSHWRTDGIGVLLLLNDLLDLVTKDDLSDPSSLPWGDEIVRLAPAIEDALKLSHSPTEEETQLARSYIETFSLAEGAIGIPCQGDRATLPSATSVAQETLDMTCTKAVVDACRVRGISVSAAAHASVAAANREFAAPDRKLEHYVSTARFSVRPYLPSLFSSTAYAAGLYTTGWMVKVEAQNTWLDNAVHYNSLYQKGLSNKYLSAHRAYASGLVDLLKSLPPDLPLQSDVDISSIGIAEALIKPFHGSGDNLLEVTAISVGVELLTAQGTCFVWTFRDQLNLSIVYNRAFHSQEQMKDFAKAVKCILLEGLRI